VREARLRAVGLGYGELRVNAPVISVDTKKKEPAPRGALPYP
jgi:hypothetical protein